MTTLRTQVNFDHMSGRCFESIESIVWGLKFELHVDADRFALC
jgi:hypothetical protein